MYRRRPYTNFLGRIFYPGVHLPVFFQNFTVFKIFLPFSMIFTRILYCFQPYSRDLFWLWKRWKRKKENTATYKLLKSQQKRHTVATIPLKKRNAANPQWFLHRRNHKNHLHINFDKRLMSGLILVGINRSQNSPFREKNSLKIKKLFSIHYNWNAKFSSTIGSTIFNANRILCKNLHIDPKPTLDFTDFFWWAP